MGKNWPDYFTEARRCLWKGGLVLIAETTNSLTEGKLSDLRKALVNHQFEILKEERIDMFTFLEAKKIDTETMYRSLTGTTRK